MLYVRARNILLYIVLYYTLTTILISLKKKKKLPSRSMHVTTVNELSCDVLKKMLKHFKCSTIIIHMDVLSTVHMVHGR